MITWTKTKAFLKAKWKWIAAALLAVFAFVAGKRRIRLSEIPATRPDARDELHTAEAEAQAQAKARRDAEIEAAQGRASAAGAGKLHELEQELTRATPSDLDGINARADKVSGRAP